MKNFTRITIVLLCLVAALPGQADLFTSADDRFSMDMPAGWTRMKDAPQGSVLSLQKANARIDIKTVSCTNETCLDSLINHDLAEVKSKQMTVLKNTYTDEEIKRIEFSTGEPFYYINFYTPKNDFSSGYFLLNGQGYSVLAKNITYAEADLIFATITPSAQHAAQALATSTVQDNIGEIDLLHSYDTQAIPDVEVQALEPSVLTKDKTPAKTAVVKPSVSASPVKRALRKLKIRWKQLPVHTLVTSNMPPYIRELGRAYDVLRAILVCGWNCTPLYTPQTHRSTSQPQLTLSGPFGTLVRHAYYVFPR